MRITSAFVAAARDLRDLMRIAEQVSQLRQGLQVRVIMDGSQHNCQEDRVVEGVAKWNGGVQGDQAEADMVDAILGDGRAAAPLRG